MVNCLSFPFANSNFETKQHVTGKSNRRHNVRIDEEGEVSKIIRLHFSEFKKIYQS